MQTLTYKLPNGLTVLLIDTKAFPSVTTLLLINAGSRYETVQNNGIAHFFEHMAFKGSKKYPNAHKLAKMIEGRGGVFNAFTSDDHTGYYVKSPAVEVDTAIDVIGDMIQHPRLDPKEIEKEKGVIIQEMNMYEDMPQRTIYEVFENLLFGEHPLGYKIIGTRDSVMAAERETFMSYIRDWYHPGNAVIVIAGGLTSIKNRTLAYYKELIQQRFGQWNGSITPQPLPVSIAQSQPAFRVQFKKSEQAHFCYGYRTFKRGDDRKYAMTILTAILGMGMTSRLFREVREKRGLCYTVHTFAEYYEDAGYMATYAGVEPNEAKITEALKVIHAQHQKLTRSVVPIDELDRAKELVKGRLVLSLEDTFNVAALYGTRQLFEKEEFDMNEYMRRIHGVTAAQVRALAKELFVEETLNVALIGPHKSVDLLKQSLQ